MRILHRLTLALALPVLMLAFAVPGCGKRTEDDIEPAPRAATGITKLAARKPFSASFDGVIKGKIILEGSRPDYKMLTDMAAKPECHSPDPREKADQRWIVDDKGGVAYAVIWLAAPKGTYFDLPKELRTRKDEVVIDQPYCAFVPHVVSAFPKYYDGKEYQSTEQVFTVKNSAKISHNTKWSGDPLKNPGGNPTLAPGDAVKLALNAEDQIQLQCNIHSWMGAKAFTFEHPFHAVTKLDGTFEIKNVPTGVDLTVVGWHDGAGYFHGGKTGKTMKFAAGDNPLTLTVTK